MRSLIAGLALGASVVGFDPLAALQGVSVIKGVFKVNGSQRPIEGARITLVGTQMAVTTDGRGEFEFPGLVPGRYVVRAAAIGFATVSSPVDLKNRQTVDMEFLTEAEAVNLPELTVEERSTHGPVDWIRRKGEGRGRYISRADIERRQAASLPDALRMLPGVRIECRSAHACMIRLARAPRGCNPAFFMDGIPSTPAIAYLTPVQEVEGVEIYSGPAETPPELESPQARCGVVVIWTRSPPPRRPKEKREKPKSPVDSVVPAVDTTIH
jgi:hypothetical protein